MAENWRAILVDRLTTKVAFVFYIVVASAAFNALDLGILHTVNTEIIRLVAAARGCG